MEAKYDAAGLSNERLEKIVHLISERANTFPEMVESASMLFRRPDWSAEAAVKLRNSVTDALYHEAIQCTIDALRDPLVPNDAQAADIASLFDQIMSALNEKVSQAEAGKTKGKGKLMKPLRHALTGENVSWRVVPQRDAALTKCHSASGWTHYTGHHVGARQTSNAGEASGRFAPRRELREGLISKSLYSIRPRAMAREGLGHQS